MRILCLPPARALPLITAALLLATLALPAQAQWKWRDKDGRVTVSDLPPPREVADKDVLQRPNVRPAAAAAPAVEASAPVAVAAPVRPPADRELDARKRAAEQEQQAKAKADEDRLAAQRADNCKRARSHMQFLDSGQRIARMNDKGEREILDDKGRADEVNRTRAVIASDCK